MYEANRAAMALTLYAGPTLEPVSIAECKTRAHIDAGNNEPAPGGVPMAVALAGVGAGNVDNGDHRYLATFVTADGETEAGIVSAVATVVDNTANGKVALSAIPVGGAAVTARKLYRTAAGGATFMLLATIADNTTSAYVDNIADASLGAGAPAINTTGDPELGLLIASARKMAEKKTRRALCTQTWELRLDDFPNAYTAPSTVFRPIESRADIWIPRPPLQSIVSITYVDPFGVRRTMDPAAYDVDRSSEPARVRPVYGTVWPSARRGLGSIVVRFVAGYGTPSDVPADLRDWILLRAATAWANRASFVVDTRLVIVESPDDFVDGMLDDYVVHTRVFN